MNTTNKILTAVGAGALVGALLGVLFAPDKGSETRRKINNQGKKMVDNVQAKFRKGREQFNGLKEEFVQSAKEKGEGFV